MLLLFLLFRLCDFWLVRRTHSAFASRVVSSWWRFYFFFFFCLSPRVVCVRLFMLLLLFSVASWSFSRCCCCMRFFLCSFSLSLVSDAKILIMRFWIEIFRYFCCPFMHLVQLHSFSIQFISIALHLYKRDVDISSNLSLLFNFIQFSVFISFVQCCSYTCAHILKFTKLAEFMQLFNHAILIIFFKTTSSDF